MTSISPPQYDSENACRSVCLVKRALIGNLSGECHPCQLYLCCQRLLHQACRLRPEALRYYLTTHVSSSGAATDQGIDFPEGGQASQPPCVITRGLGLGSLRPPTRVFLPFGASG